MPDIAAEIASHSWYHTIELPGGHVTPGLFDTRSAASKIPLPESLAGKRCLDVGTADGFWAFEMERRGAAEVVAIDLIDPSRRDLTRGAHLRKPLSEGESSRQSQTFALARRLLDSKVEWRNLSVYDLSPEEVGAFDFVFVGSLLVHLRDPVLALMRARTVTDGQLVNYEAISLARTLLRPRTPLARFYGLQQAGWWVPNAACLRQWIRAAGFDIERSGGVVFVGRPRGKPSVSRLIRHPLAASTLWLAGIAQSWVISRPGSD